MILIELNYKINYLINYSRIPLKIDLSIKKKYHDSFNVKKKIIFGIIAIFVNTM